MPERLSACWVVTAGLVPGSPMLEFTKRFFITLV